MSLSESYICRKKFKYMKLPTLPIEWKEEYNVNISFIDEHHQKFVLILNKILEIKNHDFCGEKVSEIFFSLVHYAEHYLIREEIYFKEYPNFQHHQKLHNEFIERITRLQQDYNKGEVNVCVEMANYLYNWFENHILKYDKEAVNYLKEKGH